MVALSNEVRSLLWIIVVIATVSSSVFLLILENDIKFFMKKFLPGIRPGRKPPKKPVGIWMSLYISVGVTAVGTAIASVSPAAPSSITRTILPIEFTVSEIANFAAGYETAGYGKQSCMAKNSQGSYFIFIRDDLGNIGIMSSKDGNDWSKPSFFDTLPPPGGPGVSVAIDSADNIHVVWSKGPDASDLYYNIFNTIENIWIGKTEIVATSTFARDIIVDSVNHPHIIWSSIDVSYDSFDGNEWTEPKNILKGAWHPDIQITSDDDLFVFANGGSFYPDPTVSAFFTNNKDGYWKPYTSISQSPFWSGGIASTIDSDDNIYAAWLGAKSEVGGDDLVYFSMSDGETWSKPISIGEVGTSGGSTGAESPIITSDANNVVYVIWRGVTVKKRPVIFARAFIPPNNKLENINAGWSEITILDDRDLSNVGWPCLANVNKQNHTSGITLVWNALAGTKNRIDFAKLSYP